MQGDLLEGYPTEGWKVVRVEKEQIWNEQNKLFETFITFVETIPVDWTGPDILPEGKLPWDE